MRRREKGLTNRQEGRFEQAKAVPQGGKNACFLSFFAGCKVWVVRLACITALAACGQQPEEEIVWQLPLTAPADPHGATVEQPLPGWAAGYQGRAVLAILDKRSARVEHSNLAMGDQVSLQGLDIELLGLAKGLRLRSGTYIEDENVHNPAAFVRIHEHGKLIYSGWLYQQFPELFAPDSARWKLWLQAIEIAPLPAENTGARSSAG